MRLTTLLLCAYLALAQTPDDLNFLTSHVDGQDRTQMLPRYLKAKAARQLTERERTVASIKTMAQLEARRTLVKDKLVKLIGGLPTKTPLNARTLSTLDFPTYRIEKVLFESVPGFHVTANLYVPKSPGPHPAILFPLGHEHGAKAHDAWQRVLITFAQRGYVCLIWDTIGQGERIQLWDDDFQTSKVFSSTTEHTIVGLQTLLVGDPLGRYTIWDGIRAMDYLLSRPEVDPARVGLTGNSGGGTHTAYLAAIDGRFAAAAPSCFITSWRRLLDTIGPQDAEQCLPPFLAEGLDHGDFILAFAPKPYRMLTAIRDFFSIEGARDTALEAARIYDSIGAGDRFGKFEADDGHGYTAPRRTESFRFFSRWLEGKEDTRPEPEMRILSEQELQVTKSGQVAVELPRSESVFTLNQKRLAQVKQPGATVDSVRAFTGYAPSTGAPKVKSYGGTAQLEKLTIESESGIILPALIYKPQGNGPFPAVILANGRGKLAANDQAKKLVAEGKLVLSVDLRGIGETQPTTVNYDADWGRYFGDYDSAMTAMLTGKALVIQRAEDLARAVDVLTSRGDVDAARIEIYATEKAAVPALYTAAFDRRVQRTTLDQVLTSYDAVIRGRIHRQQWENAVVGALRHYDLPDLVRWASPREVKIVSTVGPLGPIRSQ
jgi:cephalosporin-C deacetylase-like acetyl esterase